MREKTIQHYRVTLEQAKRDYQDGLLTATGLVFYAIAILKPPGQKLRLKNAVSFAEDLGIGETTFYRAVSKLKFKNLIAWEAVGGLNLWISAGDGVASLPHPEMPKNGEGLKSFAALDLRKIVDSECTIVDSDSQIVDSECTIVDSDSQIVDSECTIVDSDSQIVDSECTIVDSDSQIVDFQASKPASDKGSENSTNTLTNDLQIFYKSLSNSEREKFKKFVDKKIELLPYKIALREKWIKKNFAELEAEFRETVGNRRSINLPNLEQMAKLQEMKDAKEIKYFELQPYKKGQTIVVDNGSQVLPWWEFFESR